MAKDRTQPKIGAGHAQAMYRQGFKEIRGAFYPDSNIAREAEIGMYGTNTQSEIAQQREGEPATDMSRSADQYVSVDERIARMQPERESQEREVPEPERE